MNRADLKRKAAEYTYRLIHWGNRHVPPGLRTLVGFLFMLGGVFGFLPVLGFWMLPLGVAFVALDRWMLKLHRESEISDDLESLDHPTSSQ